MVDSAYSMADWSMNPSSLATASHGSVSPAPPATSRDVENDTSAALAALDSMYTALSTLGFQQVRPQDDLNVLALMQLCAACTCSAHPWLSRNTELVIAPSVIRVKLEMCSTGAGYVCRRVAFTPL